MQPQVLSVGQCGFDDSRISAFVAAELNAVTDRAGSEQDALQMLAQKKYDLVLVNRVFDWSGDSGIDFITHLKQAGNPTPVMLVSNYEDAQAQAIAAGALPGFGKSELGSPRAATLLRKALAAAAKT